LGSKIEVNWLTSRPAHGTGEQCEARQGAQVALGHALDFWTWRSLVHERGLTEEEAIELMVGMVSCLMRH
jgi:hypothetical protein